MKVMILGCGSSLGVPILNGDWGDCDPKNVKNRRTRSSAFLEVNGVNILIDAGPDLKEQFLRNDLPNYIDAILLSHIHYDHTIGLGELRPMMYLQGGICPVYIKEDGIDIVVDSAPFMFGAIGNNDLYKPLLKAIPMEYEFKIQGRSGFVECSSLDIYHGECGSRGFRFGNFAYTTDVQDFPEDSLDKLKNLDVWIVACTAIQGKISHASLNQVLEWVELLKPKMTYLTHMSHSIDYDKLTEILPAYVRPVYDGMVIDI